jgi:hypothetical protein
MLSFYFLCVLIVSTYYKYKIDQLKYYYYSFVKADELELEWSDDPDTEEEDAPAAGSGLTKTGSFKKSAGKSNYGKNYENSVLTVL